MYLGNIVLGVSLAEVSNQAGIIPGTKAIKEALNDSLAKKKARRGGSRYETQGSSKCFGNIIVNKK